MKSFKVTYQSTIDLLRFGEFIVLAKNAEMAKNYIIWHYSFYGYKIEVFETNEKPTIIIDLKEYNRIKKLMK